MGVWGEIGLQGPPGDQGPQGPTGPAGMPGYPVQNIYLSIYLKVIQCLHHY